MSRITITIKFKRPGVCSLGDWKNVVVSYNLKPGFHGLFLVFLDTSLGDSENVNTVQGTSELGLLP